VPVNSVLATCVAPLALQPLSLHQLPVVSVEQNRGSHTNTAADASQYSLEDFRNAVGQMMRFIAALCFVSL